MLIAREMGSGRYRLSCCFWLLAVLLLLTLLELLQLEGPLSMNSRVIRKEESTFVTFVPSKESRIFTSTAVTTDSEQDKIGVKNRSSSHVKIFKGKPYSLPSTPRSPTPLFQPTLSHPTLLWKQLHFFHVVMKSTEEILNSAWVVQLKGLLARVHLQKQVSIVLANSDYLEALLNWLIAAKVRLSPPIMNVLVICLDEDVFSVLNDRDIPSIHINPSTVLNVTELRKTAYKNTVWMVRFVVFRLITYWGYDLASYDSDALVMKNPQELFQQHRSSDIVSSAGMYPYSLSKKWGFTVCMGVILFRSTPRTGKPMISFYPCKSFYLVLNSCM